MSAEVARHWPAEILDSSQSVGHKYKEHEPVVWNGSIDRNRVHREVTSSADFKKASAARLDEELCLAQKLERHRASEHYASRMACKRV